MKLELHAWQWKLTGVKWKGEEKGRQLDVEVKEGAAWGGCMGGGLSPCAGRLSIAFVRKREKKRKGRGKGTGKKEMGNFSKSRKFP
jgi:hypothetical protein